MDIRIRTVILKAITAILLYISITGCNEDTIDTEAVTSETITKQTYPTDEISETQITTEISKTEISKTEKNTDTETETSITKNEETTAFKDYDENGIKLGIDTSPLTIIRDYEVPELSDSVIKKLEEWRKNNNIVGPNTGYIILDAYTMFVEFSGELIGNLQTPHMAIIKGEEVAYICDYDIMYSNNSMYFIKDNILYIYDYGVRTGIMHVYFVEFSALTGEKLNEYNETYQLGITELYGGSNTYDNINCTEDLQNYIYSISDTWYKGAVEKWGIISGN